MKIQVEGFRGVVGVSATVAPMLLLAGSNAAGKTSTAQAIAACASGTLLPFKGITKGKAALLVHDGYKQATAVIQTDTGIASASWPAVERATQGEWRDASPMAVGLEDLTAMKPEDCAARLIDLIGADPTEAELAAALAAKEIDAKTAVGVWGLTRKGWDAAHTEVKETGAKLKGQWEKLTGERLGVAKVQTWRPKGWKLELEGASQEGLQKALNEARAKQQDVTRAAGANSETLRLLQDEANKLTSLQAALENCHADLDTAMKRAFALSEKHAKLGAKPMQGARPLQCPCCGATVILKDGVLIAADDAPADLSKEIAEWDASAALAEKAASTRDMARNHAIAAERKVQDAQAAKDKLAKMPDQEGASESEIKAAADAVQTAELAYKMKTDVIDAMTLAQRIMRVIATVEVLAVDGLRKDVLIDRLGTFNASLVENAKVAGWAPVHIDADMTITLGGRPHSLCSASEQFRIRTILQFTVAAKEAAPLVVVDGADILDRPGRNGLFKLLQALKIPAVVGMTQLKREDMPDLAKAGLGQSVWVEAGSAV